MTHPLHEKALRLSQTYTNVEKHLLVVLADIDRAKIWRGFGYASMFEYCTQALKLSTAQAYTLIAIGRKSQEIPRLKEAILNNQLSVSNAKRLLPVLNLSNQEEWLKKGAELSTRKLEREVAIANPQTQFPEGIMPINAAFSKLTLCLSQETEELLRRAQDILSQKARKNLNLEGTIKAMAEWVIEKEDRVKKAERAIKRQENTKTPIEHPISKRPIPRAIAHQVRIRDQERCQTKLPDGSICGKSRFLEVHHLQPWAQGGSHHVSNLLTTCSAHHKGYHDRL